MILATISVIVDTLKSGITKNVHSIDIPVDDIPVPGHSRE